MITKNFKALLQAILQSSGSTGSLGYIPAKSTGGGSCYIGGMMSRFPYNVNTNAYFSYPPNAGIYFGSGNTPATENDYDLETLITSGLSASTPTVTRSADSDGNPFIQFMITITNSSASPITIREVGYYQMISATNSYGGMANSQWTFMLDRTVLDTPLTIPAGESGVLKYVLKTIIS